MPGQVILSFESVRALCALKRSLVFVNGFNVRFELAGLAKVNLTLFALVLLIGAKRLGSVNE